MKLACYPIVRPVLQLAHSRRFIVAMLSAAFIVASIQYPLLAPITNQILALAVSVITGMTVEDTAGKLKLRSPAPQAEAVAVTVGGNAAQGLTPDLIAQIAKEPAIVKALTTAVTAAIMQSPAPKESA